MKEYNLKAEPLKFIEIRNLTVSRQINKHGTAMVSGYIADTDEETYLKMLTGDVWEKIEETGKDGEAQTLFWGVVTGFTIERAGDQKRMTLELTTGTYFMDLKPHFRTFQDGTITYEMIFRQITGNYENSGFIKNRSLTDTIGKLVMQHKETDWEFLKRMAGRFHSFLVPSVRICGVKYFYDLPKGESYELPKSIKYAVKKDLGDYRKKKNQGLQEMREGACLEYIIQSREDYQLGDQLSINGLLLLVWKINSRYEKGEMIHTCHIKSRPGLDVLETLQADMSGCSFPAEVLQVKEDKVMVKVLKDENQEQKINLWYPYSTVYSTHDGTGWYCMPEIGDMVRLHIPEQREDEAYVVSSVHLDTESLDRKNPEHKIIKNKFQKEIRFTPDSIVITNNQGTKIELNDTKGVHIVSQHDIVIKAKDDLIISSETGSLIAAGTASVNLKQKTTSIDIDKGITFTGGELKVQ
ncbi:phage baseplate assembly protein V [Lacrimispora sp.]|uniref:phage baseplate assembly protein V n=1 Tax=Lacrimispora sp. TaxID=2719234 RepID=UPI0028B05717|nr:contractile injection system protein, VgrG/Pvc8 family [Lacrimispora sp.]